MPLNKNVLKGQTNKAPIIYHTFGKMSLDGVYRKWVDGSLVEISPEEYGALSPGDRAFSWVFIMENPGEFNPKLTKPYRKKVDTSDGKYGRDWRETVEPSLIKLVGEGDFMHYADAIEDKYVHIMDAPQKSGDMKDNGQPWMTLAFVEIFNTREECAAAAAAWQAQFQNGDGQSSNGSAVYPADFLAKYTSDKARTRTISEIKQMHTNGAAPADIAEEYEISEESVKALVG